MTRHSPSVTELPPLPFRFCPAITLVLMILSAFRPNRSNWVRLVANRIAPRFVMFYRPPGFDTINDSSASLLRIPAGWSAAGFRSSLKQRSKSNSVKTSSPATSALAIPVSNGLRRMSPKAQLLPGILFQLLRQAADADELLAAEPHRGMSSPVEFRTAPPAPLVRPLVDPET